MAILTEALILQKNIYKCAASAGSSKCETEQKQYSLFIEFSVARDTVLVLYFLNSWVSQMRIESSAMQE